MDLFTDRARRKLVAGLDEIIGWRIENDGIVTRNGKKLSDADVLRFLCLATGNHNGAAFILAGIFPAHDSMNELQSDIETLQRVGQKELDEDWKRRG